MKVAFEAGRVYRANKIELGDKHDQSVVHLLSTLPGEAFLVERKGGSWIVTPGQVMAETPVPVAVKDEPAVIKVTPYKLKVKPDKKKKKEESYATQKRRRS
jgi:hypothetical protein